MVKVLLINPYTPNFVSYKDKSIPIGLLYLASKLQQDKHKVKLIDINNGISIEHLLTKIDSFNPDMIGIGVLFSGRFNPALHISQVVKEQYPTVPIVLGGIHPTTFPAEILKEYSYIDYIVLGEGERTFSELVSAHFNGTKLIKDIDGLGYRIDGKIIINPKTKFIDNLDTLPFPAYDIINLKDYYFDTSKWYNPKKLSINVPLPIISSRGCSNKCSFCSMYMVHGRKFRYRSPENVVDEIEMLYKKYDHRYFSFMDDNFTFSKKRTLDICNEIINRGFNIQFDTPNGVFIKTLDKEVMDALTNAGLIRICVAPESGSEFIRNKVIHKSLSNKEIYDFFDMVKDYKNLFIKTFFVIGFPEETNETLNETYEMIKRIPVHKISIFNVVPFPGTVLFEQCKNKKLINIPLENLHNIGTFTNYNESDTPFIKPDDLEIEELVDFRKKVIEEFNDMKYI